MESHTLHLDDLIEHIKSSVEQTVRDHINQQFNQMIQHISNQYDIDSKEIVKSLHTSFPYVVHTPQEDRKGKTATVVTEHNCTGSTKAGLPCRYKVIPGEFTCKKHKGGTVLNKLKMQELPSDEQEWFENRTNHTTSFYPSPPSNVQFVTDE